MCGIFGAQWKHSRPNASERAQRAVILTVLAHEMDSRGDQSHGVYLPEPDVLHRRVGTIKQTPMHIYSEARSLFAHTRYATQGKVAEKNSHPFDIDDVIGCHNGTLSNHAQLNREYARDFKVDSQHIFKHIATGRPLSEIQGYGTVVYVHREAPSEILMAHCNGGMLTVYTTDIGLVWASTEAAIKGALQAGGVIGGKPVDTKSGHLYVAKDAELFLRKEDFLTFSGTNWRSWESFGSEDDDARYERWMRTGTRRRSVYRDGKWEDDKDWTNEQSLVARRAMNRIKIRGVAEKYVSANDARRVWAYDFNPFDPDDELYANPDVANGFDSDLYWEVIGVADRDAWPDAEGSDDETDERESVLSDIVTTEQGVFKIGKDGRLHMLHDSRQAATIGDAPPSPTTDTVHLPAVLPRELAGEEEG
jgi:hypothetical protein